MSSLANHGKNLLQRQNSEAGRAYFFIAALLIIEFVLFIALFFVFTPASVFAGVGNNVTVVTQLTVGNVFPEILNISINSGATTIDLTANATRAVFINIIARDFNGESDIQNISVEFFDVSTSFFGDSNDNNRHYTNFTCGINATYGDAFEVNATCTLQVWYYAYNSTWRVVGTVNDTANYIDRQNATTVINSLLAIGAPDSIDYGLVNATQVSPQQSINITNFGNVVLNLSLSGYAVAPGDNLSMNCTQGAIKNISIGYEKYNLTASNTSTLTIAQFESLYRNLSYPEVMRPFNLAFRENDTVSDVTNSSYWRIYVPTGVAGSCFGNIVLGARRGTAA